MKKYLSVLVAAAALSGCASTENGLNRVVDYVNQPKVQTAIASVKTVATAAVCGLNTVAGLAAAVEVNIPEEATAEPSDLQKAKGYTKLVFVSSSVFCPSLGGVATGQTVRNVAAVTAVK